MKKLILLLVGLASINAQAVVSMALAVQRIEGEIGKKVSIDATANCDLANMGGSNGGNLGTVNQVPCIMNLQNLSGVTPAGGTTRQITFDNQTFFAHFEINSPGPTINGTTYSYESKIWLCGTGCTDVNNYLPGIYMVFNADEARTVNNGILINNFSASSGTLKGTAFIKWDTGSATPAKTFQLAMTDCSNLPAMGIAALYKRVGDVAYLNDLTASQFGLTRTALTWNNATNAGNWQQDNVSNAGGDTPAWGGGFTRVAAGIDYNYSAAATDGAMTIQAYPTSISGATLAGATFQGINCATIGTTGVPAVTVGTGVISPVLAQPMNGMTTHPAAL